MPPPLAALLTIGFVVYLFRRDSREQPNITGALWIPLIWFLIITTRAVSRWLYDFGISSVGVVSLEEGSPLDACIYFVLIAAGLHVLNRRQVRLGEIVRENQWLTIFLLYCLVSIFWSDFPFVAFKRWTKVLGHPIMALVVLTEPDPKEALVRLMKRCAYVVVPISLLFIKYYPHLGRAFDRWSGLAENTGITTNKNELGAACFLLGFFLFWHVLQVWSAERGTRRRNELLFSGGLLLATCWVLLKAHSSTSLLSLLIGMLVVFLLGLRFVDKRHVGAYALVAVIMLVIAQLGFGIYEDVVNFTGRDATIAGRAELWNELLSLGTNPIFGVGFESFWLGSRYEKFAELHWWRPNQAHNGYLETYLTLGAVGLLFLVALLLAVFRKARTGLMIDFRFGQCSLGFLVAVIAYNWTEAAFKALSPVFFVFFIIALQHRPAEPMVQESFQDLDPELGEALVFTHGDIGAEYPQPVNRRLRR